VTRVLVCDDEPGIRKTLSQILGDEGYEVETVARGEEALVRARESRPDAMFLDVWLPDGDGLALLERLRQDEPELPVVMISGHGTVETAVAAVKRGAEDFLEKPLSLERVLLTLERALERRRLARERDHLRRELESARARVEEEEQLVGDSPPMRKLREEITRVGPTDARVLITGENGTGKELVARALHRASLRAHRPFVEVNAAAIPDELIESELFGHLKGSFTGAAEDRKGKWEEADGGTLFLDEVGDMSAKTQAKVLRAIQDGRITRVGGGRTIATDVRILAATNRDLLDMIGAGAFREDLYYRLNVVPVRVPTLAERAEDVPALVAHFAARLARKQGRRAKSFASDALAELALRPWRGNVRELANLVERAVLMTSGSLVKREDLPPEDPRVSRDGDIQPGQTLAEARESFEKRVVARVLSEARGNVSRAAERLGLDRTTLHRKMKALGLD